MALTLKRLGLVYLSLMFQVKDILHQNEINTIDEGYQSNLYRTEVPFYVKVTDDYDEVYKPGAVLPCIVISSVTTDEAGLQIGGGKISDRHYDIDVYARRNGERDSLTTIIYEGLDKTGRVKDYNIAQPEYVYDAGQGILVEYYSGLIPVSISDLIIENKRVEYLPRIGPSDVDSHRAVIRVQSQDLR